MTRILTGVFVALTLALALFRFLDSDELEHVHATWLVLQGQVPFRDFFEHHHPLTWFVLAPLLAITGETAGAILVFRLVFFLLTLAIARVTYQMALECAASRTVARLAALLLLSMTTFVGVAIEIRPDVPQILFSMLSVLYALRTVRTGSGRDALRAGAAAAVAILFLQKALLVFAPYPFALLYFVRRGVLRWTHGLWFLAGLAAVCAPAVGYLLATGSVDDYLISNWMINARVGANAYSVTWLAPDVLRDFARNAPFWVLVIAAAIVLPLRPALRPYAVPFWLGFTTLVLIFALNRVVDRYLGATMPLLAIGVAALVVELLDRAPRLPGRTLAALLIIVLSPGVGMVRAAARTNGSQLAEIRALLEWSSATDRVYDYDRKINVFRPDTHYYWFRVGPAPRLYQEYSGARRPVPDMCRTLADVKPAFVYRRRGELEQCGLMADYRPTTVPDLFVRRDHRLR